MAKEKSEIGLEYKMDNGKTVQLSMNDVNMFWNDFGRFKDENQDLVNSLSADEFAELQEAIGFYMNMEE